MMGLLQEEDERWRGMLSAPPPAATVPVSVSRGENAPPRSGLTPPAAQRPGTGVDMEDLARTKRNVARMVEQNAPQADIDAYIASEGYTLNQVRNFKPAGERQPTQRPRTGPTIEHEAFRSVPAGDSFMEGFTYWPRQILQTGADIGAMGVKAARDAALGVATLPTTLIGGASEALGMVPEGDTEKHLAAVSNVVPDIEFTGPRRGYAETGSELAQFAIPGFGAARMADKALRNAGRGKRILGDMLAAGSADFAVADPGKTHTIGNFLGGPTEIQPGDSPLARRTKLGTEAALFQGGLSGIMSAIGKGYNFLKDAIRPLVDGEDIAEELAQKTLRDFAHDPEGAAQRLADEVPGLNQGGFQATSGTASGDVGLLQLEKGLGRKPGKDIDTFSPAREFAERRAANEEAVSGQLRGVTDQPGRPEELTGYLRGEREAQLEAIEGQSRMDREALEQGALREQERLAEAQAEVDSLVHELSEGAAGRTGAAKEVDRVVRDELVRITNRKNELAGAIDPERQLVVDDSLLRQTFGEINTPKGPFDLTPSKLPQGLMGRIREFLEPEAAGRPSRPLTFGDLQDLRPEISEALKQAQIRGQRPVAEQLMKLRGMLNEYTERVAEEAAETGGKTAAMNARRFLNYYRDIYVPRFKQGAGGDINKALLRGEQIAPETTAGRFIKTTGGKQQAAQDLRRIAQGAESPAEANRAVRDYLVTDFANWAVNPRTGKLDARAIRQYLVKHRDALREFPEVRSEINELARQAERGLSNVDTATKGVKRAESDLAKQVKDAADRIKQNEAEYRKSVASMFMDRDADEAVGKIFTSGQPDRKMAELVRQVRGSQDAMEGLRAAVGDHLAKRLRGGRELRSGEDVAVMSGRVLDMMRDQKTVRALRMVYGPNAVETLKRINRQLQTAGRVNTNLAAGMPTHLARESVRPLSLALDLKFGIMRGRRYLNFMNFIRTKGFGAPDIETLAEKALTKMMLDPEAARIGLLPAKSEAAQRKLATYVMNNILAQPSDEERRQRLLERQPAVR